ncbi:hypothetical protein JXD38_12045 [candidate division WOR-3 bacterium]|nr:hypothetical protein [candidate division WOR-3 bacterium]
MLLLATPALARTAPAARSAPQYDVGLVDFTLWDTVFVGDTYHVFDSVIVRNYGTTDASDVPLVVTMFADDTVVVYSNTWGLPDLAVGQSETVYVFWPDGGRVFDSAGVYIVCGCELRWPPDQNPDNDGGIKRVVVLPRSGAAVAEPEGKEPGRLGSHATCLVGAGSPKVTWYTATGSRVRSSAARPGVYFEVRGKAVRRVVLVR